MQFQRVCIESLGYTLPDEIVTTSELETQLAPLYERLRLPEGRLELMSGIVERRFFPAGTLPSTVSIESGRRALETSRIEPALVGALIHGSVCRDHLEPATACRVHDGLGLTSGAMIYDVSNACLGILTGMIQVASMIELGQIRAGLVVGTECGRQLVENTIALLNADPSLTRDSIKDSIASLTIGSASVAVLLCDVSLSQTGNRLGSAVVCCDTRHHQLCHSDGLQSVMQTDSQRLLEEGIATGKMTFDRFLVGAEWAREDVDKVFCHQVGSAHQKGMLAALALDADIDFATYPWLGNTGAAALPITMALGVEAGHLEPNDRVALLGIGSGINSQMIAVNWQQGCVLGGTFGGESAQVPAPHFMSPTAAKLPGRTGPQSRVAKN